jgi:hypothetical protein
MNSFLSPVVQMINEVNSFSINVNNPNIPLVFALLLPVICDSKGRNEVMNFVAANGFFGCSKCLHPGQHMDGRHIYSHNSDAKASQNELRTDENLQLCLQNLIAQPNLSAFFGVKTYSVLSTTSDFSLITNCIIDSMHCLWEGIVPQFFNLWFAKKYKKKPWYIGKPASLKTIGTKMDNMKVVLLIVINKIISGLI